VAVLGVAAAAAVLVLPVRAAFGDDPLLRLQSFSPGLEQVVTNVNCGGVVSNLGRRSGGLSLYDLARDDACREAASRRAATAVATVAVVGLLAALGLAATRDREAVA
jgi:hypothetical protein